MTMSDYEEQLNQQEWFNFYLAAGLVERKLGVSGGVARRLLREACAAGDIRSVRQLHNPKTESSEEPEIVAPSEWKRAEVDLAAEGDCFYFVDLNSSDLAHWLVDKLGGPTAQAKPLTAFGKVPIIIEHLTQLYPEGVPDRAHCPREPLKADLLKRDNRLRPLDLKTLRSAIKQYNAGLGNAGKH
jgi:hypothetical protein